MRILRTDEDRFANLSGYSYEPHYVEVDGGLRVHYVDEGAGETVLLIHGEPSWCYLYRKMIPALLEAGLRVVAPDLVGFGRSDKPAEQDDYTYARHVAWMREALLDRLDLRAITLVGQDWGGLIGLRLASEHPDRFGRLVAANTGLPTGDGRMSEAFLSWQRFAREAAELPIGRIVAGGCRTELSPEVRAAYDAPFPDETYKAGARAFPSLVPTTPGDPASPANRATWRTLSTWTKPFLTAFSDGDPITRGGDAAFLQRVPGARGVTIAGAGHFLQEDKGEELARVVADFIRSAP